MIREERRYRSDNVDIEDTDLVVYQAEDGDWYVSVVKRGDRFGACVRVTTSGTPRGKEGVSLAVADLYAAMGGDADTRTTQMKLETAIAAERSATAVANERERCALVCEEASRTDKSATYCAEAIRRLVKGEG